MLIPLPFLSFHLFFSFCFFFSTGARRSRPKATVKESIHANSDKQKRNGFHSIFERKSFLFALTDAAGVINCSPEKKRRTLIGLCLAFCGESPKDTVKNRKEVGSVIFHIGQYLLYNTGEGGEIMVEIQISDNPTEIRVYTQGLPDLRRIPEKVKETIVRILVRGTVEYLQDKQNKAVS